MPERPAWRWHRPARQAGPDACVDDVVGLVQAVAVSVAVGWFELGWIWLGAARMTPGSAGTHHCTHMGSGQGRPSVPSSGSSSTS